LSVGLSLPLPIANRRAITNQMSAHRSVSTILRQLRDEISVALSAFVG